MSNKGVNLTLGRYTHPRARPAQVTPNTLDGRRSLVSVNHWYTAVLVVQAAVDGEVTEESSCDLQYRLIHAPDDEAAYAKAVALGEAANLEYLNDEGGRVTWTFLGLADLDRIMKDSVGDGAEVYSQMLTGNGESLVVDKQRLTTFWFEANKDRKVGDILRESEASSGD
jgi:hypothetical protein